MSDDIQKSVRDRISKTSQVTDICKAQIYDDVLPQQVNPPAVAVFVEESTCYEDINGSNRCFQAQVVVLAWGTDRAQANSLAKAIRDYALPADLRGQIEGMDWTEVSLAAGPVALVDGPQDGSDKWRRITKQVFTIWANAL